MTDLASQPSTGTVKFPEPGTWTIDSMHSFVTFTIEHFTIAFARGLASGPKGTINIARDLLSSSVQAAIDASTLTTANALRDQKILGPDVLDVERYPTIDFSSRALRETSTDRYALDGDLTIHGVTKPVTLDLTLHGVIVDTWNKARLGLTATAQIKRSDFEVAKFGHVPLAAGGFMVPDTLRVTLEVEATRDEPEQADG
jgi:polyisoprenoid-binding protein YceI